MNPADPNLPLLEAVVRALGTLRERFVFVGGCATGLLVTDVAAAPVRATVDGNVIVEVLTLADYHALERELEQAGFTHDQSPGAPICRWIIRDCLLDVMPTDPRVLGFGNRWFREAVRTAESVRLPSGEEIRLVTPPLFPATKLEAFRVRGRRDFLAGHDLEDIITVLDGRPGLRSEVQAARSVVRTYIASEIAALLVDPAFLQAIPGHLPGDEATQGRVPMVRERLRRLALLRSAP